MVGTCEQPPEERRAVFEAWTTVMQPAVRSEVPSGGMLRLTGFTRAYRDGTNMAIVAMLDEDM